MLIDDQDCLREWLVKELTPITDADPVSLAKYVITLLKKDKPLDALQTTCRDQLNIFLQDTTKSFVEHVFQAVQSKEYIGACTDAHKCAANPIPVISSPAQPVIASPQADLCTKSESSAKSEPSVKSESLVSIVSRALDSKSEQSSHSREEVVVSSETSHATHATTVPKSSIASVVEVPRSEARSPLPQVQPPASSESNRKIRIKSSVAPAVVNIPPPTSINLVAERTLQRLNDRSRSRSPVVPLTRRSRSKSPPPVTNTSSSSGSGIRSRLGALPTPIPTVVSKPIQSTRPEGRFDQKRLARRHSRSRSRSTSPKRRDAGPATKLVRSGPTSAYSTASSSSPSLTASTTHTSAQSGTTSTTPTIPPSSSKSSEGTPLIDTPSAHSAPPRRQRCRDYDERGFCLAGEFCPYDHGNDAIVFEDTKLRSVLHSGIPLADALQAALQAAPAGSPQGPPSAMQTQPQPPPAHLVSSPYSQPPPGSQAPHVPPAALNTGVRPVFSSSVLGAIPAPTALPPAPGVGTSAPPPSQPQNPQTQQPQPIQTIQSHPPALLTNRPPPGFPAAPTQTSVPPPNMSGPPPAPVPRPLFPTPGAPFAPAARMPNVNLPPPNFAPPVFQAPAPEYEPTPPPNLAVPNVSYPYPEVSHGAYTPRGGRGQRGGRDGGRSRPYELGSAGAGSTQLSTGATQRSGPPLSRRRSRNSSSSVVDLDAPIMSIEIRGLPAAYNTISKLNSQFEKYGSITNIQIAPDGDQSAAVVSFRTESEAQEAFYHCTTDEPPFGFPAVEVKLHRPSAGAAAPASKLARTARASTESSGTKGTGDESFSESPEAASGATARSPEDIAAKLEEARKQQSAEKEVAQRERHWRLQAQRQKHVLLQNCIDQQKILIERYPSIKDETERLNNMKAMKSLQQRIEKLRNELRFQLKKESTLQYGKTTAPILDIPPDQALNRSSSTSQESDAAAVQSLVGSSASERFSRQPSESCSSQAATPESLMPSDMFQQQSGADAAGPMRGGFRGRGRRGTPPWFAGGFPGRGRGWGGGGASAMPAEFGAPGAGPASATTRTLDRRPRALIIADVSSDSWNSILDSFLGFASVEESSYDESLRILRIKFTTRKDAEIAFSKGRTLGSVEPARIRWDQSAATPSSTAASVLHATSPATSTPSKPTTTSLHPLASLITSPRAIPASSSAAASGGTASTSGSGTGLPMSPVERLSIPESAWAAIASAVARHRTSSTTTK